MSLTRFRNYNPGEKPYSRRRTEEEWEPYHLLLSEMHAQRFTRRDMLARLKDVGFDVSPGQLLSQMKKWDMMVYGERMSQSEQHHQSFNEHLIMRTSEPAIVDDDPLTDPLDFEGRFTSKGVPPLPRLSHEDSHGDTRRFSAGQSSDATNDGTSFSSLETPEDIPVDAEHHADRDVAAYPPTYSPNTQIFSEPTMHALGADAADPSSILRQLSTITEPWCGVFPTTCCCQALFRGHGDFGKSPELYKIILEQSSPHSLRYIVALLNLVESKPVGEGRTELRTHFWDAVDYYLQICTRVELKNKLAPHILHRLLKVWEAFSDGDCLPFPTSDLFSSSAAEHHDSLINKILKTKPSTSDQLNIPDHQVDWHIEAERDVGCVVGFTVRKPSTFPLLNCNGEVYGDITSWTNNNDNIDNPESSPFTTPQNPSPSIILKANQIASHMYTQWQAGTPISTAYDLGDCNLPLIFTSLGLMITLETTSFASDLTTKSQSQSQQSYTCTLSPGLQAFIETTINTLSLSADYADKFRKAYWLIRTSQIGHTGKTIHMGEPCLATHDWTVLDRSILDYDEERTWFERRLFSGRHNSWPSVNDLISTPGAGTGPGDTASIRSEVSFNSFRRFQALALHLKIGTATARGSLKMKSSSSKSRRSSESHMSWRLEQMLQIRDDEGDGDGEEDDGGEGNEKGEAEGEAATEAWSVLSPVQRAQLDQAAFEKMQAIRE